MIAAAGGEPDRREKTGENAEHRERQGALQNREHTKPRNERDRDRERGPRFHQAIQFVGRERHQHQHTDRTALKRQRERAPRFALPPCEHQATDSGCRDTGKTQLDRHAHPALIAGVFQQRRNAEQQHHHADLHRHIAFGEPTFDQTHDRREGIGWRRARRRRPRSWRRLRRKPGFATVLFLRGRSTDRHRFAQGRQGWRRDRRGLRRIGRDRRRDFGGGCWNFRGRFHNRRRHRRAASDRVVFGRACSGRRLLRRAALHANAQIGDLVLDRIDATFRVADLHQGDDQHDRNGQQPKSDQYQDALNTVHRYPLRRTLAHRHPLE